MKVYVARLNDITVRKLDTNDYDPEWRDDVSVHEGHIHGHPWYRKETEAWDVVLNRLYTKMDKLNWEIDDVKDDVEYANKMRLTASAREEGT